MTMTSEAGCEVITDKTQPTGSREEGNTESRTSFYNPEENEQAETILRDQCKQIWEEISKVSDRLQANRPGTGQTENLPAAAILQTKAALLKAQTDIIKETPPDVLPGNEVIQFEVVRKELEVLNSQLQETLTLVQSEWKELDVEMDREELFRTEKKQVKVVLSEKLEATLAEDQEDEETRFRKTFAEVEAKESKLNKYHRLLMKKMAAFINKHFPEPTEEQQDEWRSKSKKAHLIQPGSSQTTLVSLQTILQELMNLCIESPHNPYLEITDEFWPPYVELLLRSGIASRKPDANNRIRMTPFHL